jgi:tetratricopeptide (TPR) repeat protein
MPRPKKTNGMVEGVEKVAATLAGFDYKVEPDDFVLYEVHRLIEEDRASFDDAEFRNLIDEGIRAHIEDSLETRARLASTLRAAPLTGDALTVATRVIHALEDIQSDLCNVAVLVHNYSTYLLSRLEQLNDDTTDDRIVTAADLLFESTGDRSAAETALDVLCNSASPVSVRVLAHAISEPLLDEDLESRAFTTLKSSWPSVRHYLFYNLRDHPHEDIPIRWFQLFAEVDEVTTVELALEELRAHGDNPDYREDLAALTDVLKGSRDPQLEDKVLGAINAPSTSPAVVELLRKFLEEYRPATSPGENPWSLNERAFELNQKYLSAAALFERGDYTQAGMALDELLASDPAYPFATGLKEILRKHRPETD